MIWLIQMKQEFGTVQKQPGAPWQRNFPPQQAPQIYLPAQTVFEQTSLWHSTCPSQIGLLRTQIAEQKPQNSLHNEDSYCIQNLNITGWF